MTVDDMHSCSDGARNAPAECAHREHSIPQSSTTAPVDRHHLKWQTEGSRLNQFQTGMKWGNQSVRAG